MNIMQSKLEQVFKEFLNFRAYVEQSVSTVEELRTKVLEQVLEQEGEDEYLEIMFRDFVEKRLEIVDLNQLTARLYHYYHAYKDLIEIPKEIEEEVLKLDSTYVFTIKDGKREIADIDLYNKYKQSFIAENKKALETTP